MGIVATFIAKILKALRERILEQQAVHQVLLATLVLLNNQ